MTRGAVVHCVLLCLALPVCAQDVDAFWRETRQKLALEPIEAQVEKVNDHLAYSKYKVTLRGLGAVRFACWMSIPVQGEAPAKPWPVLITASGYGGWQQASSSANVSAGMQSFRFIRAVREIRLNWRRSKVTSSPDNSIDPKAPITRARLPT
jgi:cephalosporin-C deacetylase-like acetyl esterase